MTLREKIYAGIVVLLLSISVGLVIFISCKESEFEKQRIELQNKLAERDETIEVQKNVYQKLSIQSKDLSKLLDEKDEELTRLKSQLKNSGDELLTASSLIVGLKKELQSARKAALAPQDPENPGKIEVKFDSDKDFSPFRVTGSTIGDCGRVEEPTYNVKLLQEKPIKLSVVVSQQKDGSWRTSATSSEESIGVDISLASVNPFVLEPKWYENIGLNLDIGVGTGPGFLAGTGVSYRFGKFDVGPRVWVTIDPHGVSPYFGAQLLWHPFAK